MLYLSKRFDVGRLAALTALMLVVSACLEPTPAQQRSHTTLASTREASKADMVRRIRRNELAAIQLCSDSAVFVLAVQLFGPTLPSKNAGDKAKETIEPQSVDGYYYRILTRQGTHAPGGARDYILNGMMTGGFALVAYPAKYGSSGLMTFIVNLDVVVHQKDLGPGTVEIAKSMTEYDPDATWKKVN